MQFKNNYSCNIHEQLKVDCYSCEFGAPKAVQENDEKSKYS